METTPVNNSDREKVLLILGLPLDATEAEMEKAVSIAVKSGDKKKLKKLLPALDKIIRNQKPSFKDRVKGIFNK